MVRSTSKFLPYELVRNIWLAENTRPFEYMMNLRQLHQRQCVLIADTVHAAQRDKHQKLNRKDR